MNCLLDAGCNLVDTAACYGESEVVIGRHLRHRRDEMVLVSKCGHHDVLADGRMRSRSISMADVDLALHRLQTDHLDVMLLHSYDFDLLVQGDALAVLEQARDAGKIKHIGYSGDNERAMWAAQCPLVDVLEMSVNLVDQYNCLHALTAASQRDVAVIAKRPLANAAWLHAGQPEAAQELHRHYARRFGHMELNAEQYGCSSMAACALRFTLGVPGVHCAIPSSARDKHVLANIAAHQLGPLSAASMQDVQQRFVQAELTSGGTWLACN